MISVQAHTDVPRQALSIRPSEGIADVFRDCVELYCVPHDKPQVGVDGDLRDSRLKKPLAIRIDADLLAATRACARRDNRSLTNFIETALRFRVEEMMEVEPAPTATTKKGLKA